jgi:hypothetical protein
MKDITIDNLFEKHVLYLEGEFDDREESLNSTIIKRFKRFLFNIDSSNLENNVKNEIKLLLYNSRDEIK